MKTLAIISLLLLSLITITYEYEECQKVTCAETNTPNTCSLPSFDGTKFQLCPKNKYCSFSLDDDMTPGTCQETKNKKVPKYPGMDCTEDADCVKNTCIDGKCKAVKENENCTTAFECDYGLTCIEHICTTPKKEGETCKVDYDCELTSGCHDGICVKYFTLPDRNITGYVNFHEKGLSLCKSGYATEFSECATLTLINPNEPCDENNVCTYKNGSDIVHEPNHCLCGLNSKGNRYCKYGSGDAPFQNYVKLLKNYYFNSPDCHITERGEGACSKDLLSEDLEIIVKVRELERAKIEALYNTQVMESDECVRELVYPDLYEGENVGECGKYTCKDKLNTCAKTTIDNEKLEVTLSKCQNDEICDINGDPNILFYKKRNQNKICVKRNVKTTKYPGEVCDRDSQCKIVSSNNQLFGHCLANKCYGYKEGEKCSSSIECVAGTYCENSLCVAQKAADSECKNTEECQNNLLCYQGKCQDKIYSFDDGEDVTGLPNQDIYCKFGLAFNNKCVSIKETSKDWKECELGTECAYKTYDDQDFTRKCGCGYNDKGKGYCPRMHDYNKSKWEELFKLKKASFKNNCHTLNRYTCETENAEQIKNLEFETTQAHLYYNSVKCAKSVIGGLSDNIHKKEL